MAGAQVNSEQGSTSSTPFVASTPEVIKANVTIFHPQLRDLLQPAWEKGKVLFIHQMAVEYVDFDDHAKKPTQLCSLNFAAVCLTTGSGLMAAGGEHSELDIRPAFPRPANVSSPPTASGRASQLTTAARFTADAGSEFANLPRWHLRTPTGGSINNSICIQPEHASVSMAFLRSIIPADEYREKMATKASIVDLSLAADQRSRGNHHRGKRRKEDIGDCQTGDSNAWRRDEPWGRPGEPSARDGTAMQSTSDHINSNMSVLKMQDADKSKALRILISNNDKSVKAFRLRPPARSRTDAWTSSSSGLHSGCIEHGLPGLSRTQTVQFPTCINHSSFSPDGKLVVSVGDTPEVFLYSVHPITGDLQKITSYTAASDAAFSTSWSPDSLQFAVASQDGNVSVWDVRSSEKVANLQTLQISDLYGAGAARVVKWSPCGRILAFSEQQNYVHLVDTTTFEVVQQLRIPNTHHHSGSNTADRYSSTADVIDTPFAEADAESIMSDEETLNDLVGQALRDDSSTNGQRSAMEGTTSTSSEIVAGESVGNGDWITSTSPGQFMNTSRSTTSSRTAVGSLPRRWLSGHRYRDLGGLRGGESSPTSLARRVSALDRALLGDWTGEQVAQPDTSRPLSGQLTTSRRLRTYAEAVNPGRAEASPLLGDPTTRALEAANAAGRPSTTTTSLQPHRQSGLWTFGNVMNRFRRNGADQDCTEISGLTWDPDGDFLYVSTTHAIFRYTVLDTRSSMPQATLR